MTIRILGPFEVVQGGRPVPLGGSRQRAVLAMLALNPNRVISVDHLAEELWSGSPPPGAATTLRGYVHHLRKALQDLPLDIETQKPGYVLTVDLEEIDAHRFERLVEEARRAPDEPDTAAERYRQALALWRGPALADFTYERFAETAVARLEELRLAALEERISVDLRLGRHGQLVSELQALVAEHPLREGFRGELMLALHATGRRPEALRVYTEGRHFLAEELGLDPGIGLQRLEQAILLQDDTVAPPERLDPSVPAGPVTPPGNLPVSMTTFLGRDKEVEEVAGLLARWRLVTITGSGGSGKTRLALETARTVAARHDGGAWLVELAPLADGELVPRAVATALGIAAEADRPMADTLADALARRDCVIVLDNCEHLLAGAAELVAHLLRRCPQLRILATSRERLGLSGEAAWRIPPLAVPDDARPVDLEDALRYDAVRLFVERAAAFPSFAASERNVAAIIQICRRLDGIPLAIELAAARLSMLSAEQVASRLDQRFRLLTNGTREALPRHQTLRAAVETSYEVLPAAEQVLFGRLSTFSGPFTIEAAEAVGGDDGIGDGIGIGDGSIDDGIGDGGIAAAEVLDLLAALVDKSLVNRVDGPDGMAGYRLLETLRYFGAERLAEAGDEAAVRNRHAAALTACAEEAAEQLRGPESRIWLHSMDARYEDMRAALGWVMEQGDTDAALRLAASLWRYWNHRYYPAEGRTWLSRALAREGGSAHWRAAALVGLADMAWLLDDYPAAIEAIEAALALYPEAPDPRRQGHLLASLAEITRHHFNDPVRGEALCREAAAVYAAAGDLLGEANALRVMTLVVWDQGDLPRAMALAQQCHRLFERGDDLQGTAGALSLQAGLARDSGDLTTATDLSHRSLAAFRQADEPWGTAHVVRSLGTLALARGDDDLAFAMGEESLQLHEELGNARGVAESLLVMGEAALNRGQLEEAEMLCGRALAQFRERGFAGDVTIALQSAARVALRRGSLERAAALCEEALVPYRSSGHKRDAAPAVHLLGVVRARQGAVAAAAELYQESLELFGDAGDHRGVARSLEGLAEAALGDGDPVRAARYLSAARSRRAEASAPPTPAERPDILRIVAGVWAGLGDSEFARQWAAEWESAEWVTDEIDIRAGAVGTTDAKKAPPSGRGLGVSRGAG